MEKALCGIFKELRTKHGYQQQEIAMRLNNLGIKTANTQISRWENGHNNPNILQFIGLCKIYGIKDVYKVFIQHDFSELSRELNREGNEKLEEYRQLLILSGLYAPVQLENKIVRVPRRTAPLYDFGASAGTGQFLDSCSYEMVEVPDGVPDSATFGLHVCGDSMEPTLHDGENIWVQMQQSLNDGDIGLFYLDGNAYVKEYRNEDGKVFLVSHNPQYANIEITEFRDARVYGKVVYPNR